MNPMSCRSLRACFMLLITGGVLRAEGPAVTVYNRNFATVRETLPLTLKRGVNEIAFADTTAHVEPDSVILRDPAGKFDFRILEQNYRSDPISEGLLLNLYEGKTIDFQVGNQTVTGKIVRSGYVPHTNAFQQYGQQYYMTQMRMAYGSQPGSGGGQPIIELDGILRFGLPGTPLFPALTDDTILKPTLYWTIEVDRNAKFDAELCYLTGGMTWEADYNAVAPETGDTFDLIGWVTIDNQSGRHFEDASIKLMAGDVKKLQEQMMYGYNYAAMRGLRSDAFDQAGLPPVSERAFDEYHLYTLNRRTTLRDRQTKQVEFIRANGVESTRLYVYDGVDIKWQRYQGWGFENIRQDANVGTDYNDNVWVMREFKNSEANHLGMPLPEGRVRFYRRDTDGQIEFTGENVIDHTPKDETVRIYTGNAFDLIGERRRTHYNYESNNNRIIESFEISLRNHKDEAVEIRVVEHLYRWSGWDITEKSTDLIKKESQTIEFPVEVPANGETKVTYTVTYSW